MAMGERNLARLAERTRERLGDYESLVADGRTYRAGELFERTRRVSTGLREHGVEPGDRVAVFMANCPEVGITYNAAWRAGAAVVPAVFLLPPEELRHVLSHSGAKMVITNAELVPTVQAAAEPLDHVEQIFCVDDTDAEGVRAFAELEAADPGPIVPRADDELAALLYTGGTTGRSKGVMLTHGGLNASGQSAMEHTYVPNLARTLVPLPLSHSYGLMVTVAGMHSPEPGFVALMRWFDPAGFLQLVQEHKLERANIVPTMLHMLLAQPLEDYDLSSLKLVGCGAAPLPVDLVKQFESRVPGVEIAEGYGLTETGAILTATPPGKRKLGSVGTVVPGFEVRILDDEGNDVAVGEPGEICARGPGIMAGYWQAPEATEAAIVDGWLHTGDIGYLDEEGYLTICDRKKDLIIRGGFNVFPSDVEDALLEHPAVAMAGVVGRPDPETGEEIVAFVSLHPGAEATEGELVAFGKERLGGYKYPREVRVIDQVPLTPVLKTDRKALRALVQPTA